jgi:hypothetical protein
MKYSLAITGYASWCGLGFYRGIKSYKYKHDSDKYKHYSDKYKHYSNKYKISQNYLYSDSIIYGFYGLIIYMNPPMFPFTIYKELYRLEVNVRNLEDEKKTEYYHNIIS